MAMPPRSTAGKLFSAPDSLPIGVRSPPTMTDPGIETSSEPEDQQISDQLELRVLGSPHRLVHLPDRIVDRLLGQAFPGRGEGYGDADRGGYHAQVRHRRQQRRAGGGRI